MLQEKSFESGRAFRITAELWVGGWRGTKHHTVVVRTPNSRYDTFRPAIVATEGIAGQPQMTFETEEEAKTWLNDHRSFFGNNFSYWRVGRTRSNYTCYKVPLEDGYECWLSVIQFPAQGSPEWDRLVRLYPDYFRYRPGFFTESSNDISDELLNIEMPHDLVESVNRTFTSSDDVTEIVENKNLSDDQKCRKLWDRPWNYVKNTVNLNYHNWSPAHSCRHFGVKTLFCAGHLGFNIDHLEQSFEHYVSNPETRRNDALSWWSDIKESIEFWEDRGDAKKPNTLGFFSEDLEVENKTWNTVYKLAVGYYTDRVVVRIPKIRTDTFEWSIIPQMSTGYRDVIFFSEEEGNQWIEDHRDRLPPMPRLIRNRSNWGAWEKFVKIPLSDGSVVHMSYLGVPYDPDAPEGSTFYSRYFPSAGETEDWCRRWWQKVRRLYPEYFGTRRLGFFLDERLINTNFTEQEIKDMLADESLTGDQICNKLFKRSEQYVLQLNWLNCDYIYAPSLFPESNFTSAQLHNIYTKIFNMREDKPYEPSIQNYSLTLVRGWSSRMFDIRECFRYYGNTYKHYNYKDMWDYMKTSIEIWEDNGLVGPYTKQKLGFFSATEESLEENINRTLTGQQVEQIMSDQNLTEEQKCFKLFGRSLNHVLQYGRYSLDVPDPEDFPEFSEEEWSDLIYKASDDTNRSRLINDVRYGTFLVLGNKDEPYNLSESYDYYVLGKPDEKYGDGYRTTDPSTPYTWWKYTKDVVEIWEKYLNKEPGKLGFFNNND